MNLPAAFEHQLQHLAGSSRFRAITYDPRAQGLSTTTIEGHFYEQHARDLHRLITRLEIDEFVLVGWSAGGGVLEYVRLYGQENLRGLVLLDTPPKARGTDYTKEYPSPQNLEFVNRMTNPTPNSIAALLNTSYYWYLDNTNQAEDLNGNVPLLYFTRDEWHDLAVEWANEHTPAAVVESYRKAPDVLGTPEGLQHRTRPLPPHCQLDRLFKVGLGAPCPTGPDRGCPVANRLWTPDRGETVSRC